ncbi:MAG: hypothetical protein ACUVQ8_07470 [Nitrososphaeria archaeon]
MNSRHLTLLVIVLLALAPVVGLCQAAAPTEFSLAITPALNSVPADGKPHPAFYVVVLDGKGNPHLLDDAITVAVTSSDERVLKVPDTVKIDAKGYYAIVNGTSTILEKKSVEVAVSSSGFRAAKASISVEPPAGTPTALDVVLLPNVLAPEIGAEAGIVVTIVDAYNKPTRARSDLSIKITSSNPQIASVTESVVKIAKGEFSARSSLKTTGFIGSSTVTASSPDLKSDTALFTVSGPRPEKLNIWLPKYLLANESSYLPVMITDKDNRPARVPYPIVINLYSSNETVLSVQKTVTIDVDKWYVLAKVNVKNCTGDATLYASAENMTTSSVKVTVVNSVGYAVTVKGYVLAPNFPADEKNYTGLMVQTLNKTGFPCKVNSSIIVNVYSSYAEVFEAQAYDTIAVNTSSKFIPGVPKLPGNAKLTFVAQNFIGTEATVSVYAPIASTTNIIVPPIPSEGTVEACITFSGAGFPAPVQEDTTVTLASSNTKVAEVESTAVIAKKEYFAIFRISGKIPGNFFLSASGGGIPSVSMSIPVHEVRPSKLFLSTVKPLVGTKFPVIVQILSTAGPPAVVGQLTTVNVASSNSTVVKVPDLLYLMSEKSDTLFYADVPVMGKTTSVVVSSSGFLSSSLQISPVAFKAELKLVADKTYLAGSSIQVKAIVTLDGRPYKDAEVTWRGIGLEAMSTMTNANGTTQNTLLVQEGENMVEALTFIPSAGQITNKTKILGLRQYTLSVSSDIDASIDISPSSAGNKYRENMTITLTAPSSVPMQGIFGMLGGKYNFAGWSGATSSTTNPLKITASGRASNINIKADYSEDISVPIFIIVVIIIVAVIIALLLIRRYRGRMKPPEEAEEEAETFLREEVSPPKPTEQPKTETPEETKHEPTKAIEEKTPETSE